MIAIVLAAGYATRLYPLTENFPKPLLPVNEKPILNWLLDDLEEQEEITGYVIVSNHKFIGYFEGWKETLNYKKPVILWMMVSSRASPHSFRSSITLARSF